MIVKPMYSVWNMLLVGGTRQSFKKRFSDNNETRRKHKKHVMSLYTEYHHLSIIDRTSSYIIFLSPIN